MLFASKIISEMDPGMIIAVDESMKIIFIILQNGH